jgi:glycosyltransferase involved in cell wall biosynthesis
MEAGFDYARGNYIITMDADLQNDPHDIPMMLDKLKTEDIDVVCGWRYNRKDSFFKNKFSKFSNGFRQILTGDTIHDSGCTLRIYKKECTEDLALYGELHRYIPTILLWKGYTIGEIKTNHRARKLGKSKYNWKRLYKGFLDLFVVTFWQKFSARPMHLFGGLGIIISIIGFIITTYLVIEKIFYGAGLSDRPLFFIGIFLILIGIQFFALGVLADIMLKVYHGQEGKKPYLVDKVIE